jgi:predicted ArsR family transcriptional regulator
MLRLTMKPLDPTEDGLATLLERCGLPRAQARIFITLSRGGGASAPELALAAGLSRQQAGEAANALELAGLAQVEHVASGGRPSKRYRLARGRGEDGGERAAEGVRALIAARRAALAQERAALDELEARFA